MTSEQLLEHVSDAVFGNLFTVHGIAVPFTQQLLMLWITALLALAVVTVAARVRLAGYGRMASLVEMLIVGIRDGVVFPAMGEKYGRKYLTFFLTIAMLILISNLLGLIPVLHIGHFKLGGTATGNMFINVGLATLVYFYGVGCAVKEHGLGGYLKSFLPHGIPIVLAPFLWVIEFGGMLIKHAVLAIRLTANMIAGHLVLYAILGMILIIVEGIPNVAAQLSLSLGPIVLALAIYMLEVLVAFIQTAVFTILSAIFFGMAVNPQH